MKIGIDISMLVYDGSGVATYTYNLVKNLLLYHQEHDYHLFYSSLRRPHNFQYLTEFKGNGAHIHDYRFPPRVLAYLWNRHSYLPVELMTGKLDVYHSSDFLRPPLFNNTTGVTTIHDLTWKLFPEYHTNDIVEAHERKLKQTLSKKDIIITDSENTKNDLLKIYPSVSKSKVYVLPLGIDEKYKILKEKDVIKKVLEQYDVEYPSDFILYVGAIEPRKNVDRSIEVFADLIKDKKYAHFNYYIIGRAGWKNENVFALIKKLHLEEKIKFLGFVDHAHLPHFYNGARALIYLSSYEGFGLPPLEAAACGTPTLMYNNSSLKEIMPHDYDFASTQNEVETLKDLIEKKSSSISKVAIPTWKEYATSFIQILKKTRQ